MEFNLWTFLSLGTVFCMSFAIVVAITQHKQTMKKLDIEAIKAANGQATSDED